MSQFGSKYWPLVILGLITLGERTLLDLGPNREILTASSLLVVYYWGRKTSITFTILMLILSDLVIGNSSIFLFTWSGFLFPLLIANKLLKNKKFDRVPLMFKAALTGIGFNLFFFTWTNFGVWWLDHWQMYPNTLAGLGMAYVNGLPFLRWQLQSTLIFVTVWFGITQLLISQQELLKQVGLNIQAKTKNLVKLVQI